MSEDQNTSATDDVEQLWKVLRGTDRTIRRIFISGGAWSMAWIFFNVIGLQRLSDLVLGLGMAGLVLVGSLGLAFEADDYRQSKATEMDSEGLDE